MCRRDFVDSQTGSDVENAPVVKFRSKESSAVATPGQHVDLGTRRVEQRAAGQIERRRLGIYYAGDRKSVVEGKTGGHVGWCAVEVAVTQNSQCRSDLGVQSYANVVDNNSQQLQPQ